MTHSRVLVIDDDEKDSAVISETAKELGYDALTVSNPLDFESSLLSFVPDIVVSSINIPNIGSESFLRTISQSTEDVEIILVGSADAKVIASINDLGVRHGLNIKEVLCRPVAPDDFKSCIERINLKIREHSEKNICDALNNNEFEIVYQPKLDLRSRSIFGVESQIHWQHPRLGRLTAKDFMSDVEHHCLMLPLVLWTLGRVIKDWRRWEQEGLSISTGVAVAPSLLDHPKFPDLLSSLVDRKRFDASFLQLGFAEKNRAVNTKVSTDVLVRLCLLGFRLSIDNFGPGTTSIIALHRRPFSELKIGQSLIGQIGTDETFEPIVRTVINLGHNIGLTVCADGVDTDKAHRFLESAGCDFILGQYVSHPLTAEEIVPFMHEWKMERVLSYDLV